MASPKQNKANKINSEKSTGPKTEEGKAVVSKNAIKHGLLSSETIFSWENNSDLHVLREKLVNTLQPEGELEEILVDRIVSATWRLRRAGRIETGMFEQDRYSLNYQIIRDQINKTKQEHRTIRIDENLVRETHQRLIEQAIKLYPDLFELGLIFSENKNVLSNLQRYESAIERSLFKALHELQRLQAARQGKSVPLPIAIDLNGEPNSSAS